MERLICAQAQESLQLMRGPLDKHTELLRGGDLRLQFLNCDPIVY